jgi:hypothetical protein
MSIAGAPTSINNGGSYAAEAGSDRIVVIAPHIGNTGAAATITGVTWGSLSLGAGITQAIQYGEVGSEWGLSGIFYVKEADIPVGSEAISITVSAGTVDEISLSTLTGRDQTTPVRETGSAETTSTSSPIANITASVAGDDAVLAAHGAHPAMFTTSNNGWTTPAAAGTGLRHEIGTGRLHVFLWKDNCAGGATADDCTVTKGGTSGRASLVYAVFAASAGAPSAATLSSATPSGTLATETTATIGATTDQTSGTFYAVVDTVANISGVTATQIKAGQRASGAAALKSGNSAVSTTTPSVGVTALTASTEYGYAVVQNNANGDSNVLTGSFTTASPGVDPPDLTDVDGDEIIVDGQVNVIATGTDMTGGTFDIVDGSIVVPQSVDSVSATSAQLDIDMGDARYGSRVMRVTTGGGSDNLSITIVPDSETNYVNLTDVYPDPDERLTADPDLAIGDQIRWFDVVGGTIADVTVMSDGRFFASPSVTAFGYEVNDGTGWGDAEVQTVADAPDPFTFEDVTDVPPGISISSDVITISGLNDGEPQNASVADGELRKNSGSWTAVATTVVNGDTLEVRHDSSSSYSDSTVTTLTVGPYSATFTSTTQANAAPEFDGPAVLNFTLYLDAAIDEFDFSELFTDLEALTFALTGTLPDGLNFDTGTGILSGTPTELGDFDSLYVTASDGTLTTNSNTFSINVAEAGAAPIILQRGYGSSRRQKLAAKELVKFSRLVRTPHDLGGVGQERTTTDEFNLPGSGRLAISCTQPLAAGDITVNIGETKSFTHPALAADEIHKGNWAESGSLITVTTLEPPIGAEVTIYVVDLRGVCLPIAEVDIVEVF